MFTEHEVELFALHKFFNLNEFFLLVCVQHTDKNVPRKWLYGDIFLVLCSAGSLELRLLDPTKVLPWTHWGAYSVPPRQPATPGNKIRSLHIVLSAGYHFHPCPHDKFDPPL